MSLRPLELQDAPAMLEWMHDPSVVINMKTNFAQKKLHDCETFILQSHINTNTDIHLAIADDNNIYQGTVSLKHINKSTRIAEFAITIRKTAMGTGIAHRGMLEMLLIGHKKQNLNRIYWCVSPQNTRAVRFYDKNHFQRTNVVPQELLERYSGENDLIWYVWSGNTNNQ